MISKFLSIFGNPGKYFRFLITLQLLIILWDNDFVISYMPFELLPFFIIAATVAIISNNANLGLAVSVILSYSLCAINKLKLLLLKTVISTYDIFYLKSFELFLELLRNYSDFWLWLIVILHITFFAALIIYACKNKKQVLSNIPIRLICSLCACVFFYLAISDLSHENSFIRKIYKTAFNFYKPEESFTEPFKKKRGGTLTHIIIYSEDPKITTKIMPPAQSLAKNMQKLLPLTTHCNGDRQPDIIIVLHESIINVNNIIDIENIPQYALFDRDKLNCIGDLKVNIYGGATHISEFNILTGIALEKLPGFYQINPHALLNFYELSIPIIFKKAGYETHFITGVDDSVTGGGESFLKYGFDHILDEKTMYKTNNPPGNSDILMFEHVLEILQKNTGRPKLIFVETMQNHGPYKLRKNTKQLIKHEDKNFEDRFNDYLTRLGEVDKDFGLITNYVEQAKKDTILIYFGDHHPPISYSFKFKRGITDYHTFYAIKSNFPIDSKLCPQDLNITYMPSLILDLINKNDQDIYQLNSYLRKKYQGKFTDDHALCVAYSDYITEHLATKYELSCGN